MQWIRRIDRIWASGESALTVIVLILMVLVAGFQAVIRNVSRFGWDWASDILTNLEWADSFLRKGTLWLAFLGASLATYYGRHIGIDILIRISPPRPRYIMRALSGVLAGIITLGLVICFSDAVYLNLTERPLEYEVLSEEGESLHVCDATDERLAELDFVKPTTFCIFRAILNMAFVPAETPGAAFQIIVPIMLFIVAIRLIAQGIGAALVVLGGPIAIAAADAERDREEASRMRSRLSDEPPAPEESSAEGDESDKASEEK